MGDEGGHKVLTFEKVSLIPILSVPPWYQEN